MFALVEHSFPADFPHGKSMMLLVPHFIQGSKAQDRDVNFRVQPLFCPDGFELNSVNSSLYPLLEEIEEEQHH